MTTTTVRVDRETHARLVELSSASGESVQDTVRAAAEALERQRFGRKVAAEFAQLQADPEAYDRYVSEAEGSHVTDGVGR